MTEHDACNWCTTSRVVNDLTHHTLHIAVTLSKVIDAEFAGTLAMLHVGLLTYKQCK